MRCERMYRFENEVKRREGRGCKDCGVQGRGPRRGQDKYGAVDRIVNIRSMD